MSPRKPTRKPPFDGGPAHPCNLSDIEKCGISVRAELFRAALPNLAADINPDTGKFRHTPLEAVTRARDIADAGLDILEVAP